MALGRGQVAERVLLCGDPGRVERISRGWDDVREVCRVREFRVATGRFRGVELSAASTGIGAPSTAILVEELVKLGSHTLLRVGNSGGLAPDLALGDLVVTTGAVRDDGTSRSYVAPEYPAVADHALVALSSPRPAPGACAAARASRGRSTPSTCATRRSPLTARSRR